MNNLNDYEFLYIVSQYLKPVLCFSKEIGSRRESYLNKLDMDIRKPSSKERNSVTKYTEELQIMLIKEWCSLFDQFNNIDKFIFPSGYALLFFLSILWYNHTVLLRGHIDSDWILRSSGQRQFKENRNKYFKLRENGSVFLEEISQIRSIKDEYPSYIPELHKEAILQHYGFPTDLIDATYSFDVSLFFAEGGTDYGNPIENNKMGAIYCWPKSVFTRIASLTTLPKAILRPNLQKGVFISLDNELDKKRMETFKFIFYHKDQPSWNGLHNIKWGSPIGLGAYLFPYSDPLKIIADKLKI